MLCNFEHLVFTLTRLHHLIVSRESSFLNSFFNNFNVLTDLSFISWKHFYGISTLLTGQLIICSNFRRENDNIPRIFSHLIQARWETSSVLLFIWRNLSSIKLDFRHITILNCCLSETSTFISLWSCWILGAISTLKLYLAAARNLSILLIKLILRTGS